MIHIHPPTPRTDAMLEAIGDPRVSDNPRTKLCRELERQLTVARESLMLIRDATSSTRLERVSTAALAATAPKS